MKHHNIMHMFGWWISMHTDETRSTVLTEANFKWTSHELLVCFIVYSGRCSDLYIPLSNLVPTSFVTAWSQLNTRSVEGYTFFMDGWVFETMWKLFHLRWKNEKCLRSQSLSTETVALEWHGGMYTLHMQGQSSKDLLPCCRYTSALQRKVKWCRVVNRACGNSEPKQQLEELHKTYFFSNYIYSSYVFALQKWTDITKMMPLQLLYKSMQTLLP